MQKLRVLDLFSGIGGFSLGLERTGGFETVRFCEMKPHARAVLEKNFGPVPCDEDVTKMEFVEGEADVITAGFPCQDLSFAGDGAGLSGARSGLYREVIRAIRVVRPIRAVLENVAALLSRGLGTVLGDLAEIGHDAEWHCIPASAVGAPHRRDRVWIVTDAGSEQHKSSRPPLSGSLAAELSRAFARNAGASAWDGHEAYAQHTDADCLGSYREGVNEHRGAEFRDEQISISGSLGEDVADAKRLRQPGQGKSVFTGYPEKDGEREAGNAFNSGIGNQWSVEPNVGRVAHGVPNRVDRLAELGNAVVPQIPEMIGRAILEAQRAAA